MINITKSAYTRPGLLVRRSKVPQNGPVFKLSKRHVFVVVVGGEREERFLRKTNFNLFFYLSSKKLHKRLVSEDCSP